MKKTLDDLTVHPRGG